MASTEKDPTLYMEKAPMPTAILHMAIPMLKVVDLVYNMINAFFIGRLDDTNSTVKDTR